ncbi:YceD family protein [Ectothiorhodospira mobilis]|uniref:YceD family protein n=1 Tax=Ectothiorhodospira mobilis TaxID=195064 RepID=UPI0019075A1E|nr:YceD family protein [Ectothiorhodospira mobilis]
MPERVDPLRLANRDGALQGVLGLESMPRLREAVQAMEQPAHVGLRCVREYGRMRVEGEVRAQVELLCQRCLQPVSCSVASTFQVVPAADMNEACALEADAEPVLLDHGLLPVHALVEEEILLALPAVPLHADGACTGRSGREFTAGEVEAAQKEERGNPFAVLGRLKGDPGDGD